MSVSRIKPHLRCPYGSGSEPGPAVAERALERAAGVSDVAPMPVGPPVHVLVVHTGRSAELRRPADGTARRERFRAGEALVNPAGWASRPRWQGDVELLLLGSDRVWLEKPAAGSGATGRAGLVPRCHFTDPLSKMLLERLVAESGATGRAGLVAGFHLTDPLSKMLLERLVAEYTGPGPADTLYAPSLAQAAAAMMLRVAGEGGSVPVREGGLSPRRLAEVVDFVHANPSRRVTPADPAAVAGVSESHFTRAFRTSTGQSPHRYLTQRRLDHARRELVRTDRPIAEIATEAGFSDQSQSKELYGRNISVNTIAPGPMDTSFFCPAEDDESVAHHKSSAMNGDLTKIEDIVPWVRHLLTDDRRRSGGGTRRRLRQPAAGRTDQLAFRERRGAPARGRGDQRPVPGDGLLRAPSRSPRAGSAPPPLPSPQRRSRNGGVVCMVVGMAGEQLRAEDPREIAGYRLLARIGEGGMGTVYLSHTRGGQPVALKVIRREYGSDPGFRRRFEQEVQAARRVQGYHVVPVVDHDTDGEQPWLASVFIPGLPLHEALAAHGPLPLPSVLQLVGCTAKALTAIHSAGIVHRDLKPSNILLSPQGPYVIDFGIARASDATQLTMTGGVIGTPQFMSPEHALGEPVGPATDVFSLGLIAAVAATGRHPYGDGGALTLAAQIANTAQRPPRLDGHDDRLRPLLERCLAADPAQRIGAEELAALCERAAGRSLNDFTGWLPEPLAADLIARERAVLAPPPEPTVTDGGGTQQGRGRSDAGGSGPAGSDAGGSGGGGSSTASPHGPTFAGAPTVAPPPPTYSPQAPAARRTPTALVVAGAAGAVVLAVVVAWTLTRPDGTSDEGRSNGKASTGPAHSAPAESSPTAGDDSGYTVVFKDRPFALRSPSGANIARVDLDVPQVVQDTPGREIMLSEISGGRWEFYTPMGKAAGATPAQCLTGAQSDVLPEEIAAADLPAAIPVGTRLCTVTTDDRLAMLEITRISTAAHGNLPDYTAKLTLWQKR